MSNNTPAPEPKERKQCPFSGQPCIGDKCTLLVEIGMMKSGMVQKQGVCAFVAFVMIAGSPKPQPIQMPPGLQPFPFGGRG